jgi:molybdopterin-guanine dinucleotide biosynthesis protein B
MRIFGLAGWSGSGKTTLVTGLLPALTGQGYTVSTMKHAHHNFDIDKPGKDSHRHRAAGASEVLVTSTNRWALLHENRGAPEPSLEQLVQRMSPVDLLLVEGFKAHAHDKLEIHRPSVGKPLLTPDDPHIVAIATDEPDALDVAVPILDLNDVPAIAAFVVDFCDLPKRGRDGAA